MGRQVCAAKENLRLNPSLKRNLKRKLPLKRPQLQLQPRAARLPPRARGMSSKITNLWRFMKDRPKAVKKVLNVSKVMMDNITLHILKTMKSS